MNDTFFELSIVGVTPSQHRAIMEALMESRDFPLVIANKEFACQLSSVNLDRSMNKSVILKVSGYLKDK